MYEKIAIVGAGPSGSSAAIRLLESDVTKEVTIYEKRKQIGFPPRCAGGLHGSRAEAHGIKIPDEVIKARIKKLVFRSPHQTAEFNFAEMGFDDLKYYTIDRTKFDQFLAEKAESMGAKIETNVEVWRPVSDGSLEIWGPTFQGEIKQNVRNIGFDVLIAAAGFKEGPFSDMFDVPPPEHKDMATCLQYVMRVPDYPQDTMTFIFGKDVAPGGYAWIFPAGYYDIRIGLGIPMTVRGSPVTYLDALVERMWWTKGQNFKEVISRMLPAMKLLKTGVVRDNVLLAGDQLHATDPLTGGGIIPAILTGRAAADAILAGNIRGYDALWKPILEENKIRYKAKKLFAMSDRKLDRLVEVFSQFRPKELKPGEEVKQLLKFIARKDPMLLASLVRILL